MSLRPMARWLWTMPSSMPLPRSTMRAVDAGDDQHMVKVSSAACMNIHEVPRFEREGTPVESSQPNMVYDVIVETRRKGTIQYFPIIFEPRIQQPKVMWIDIRAHETRIAQDRDGQRST